MNFARYHETLIANGFSPLPVTPRTKAVKLRGWQRACLQPLSPAERAELASGGVPYGVGIACGYGGLVALDRDTENPDVLAALVPIVPLGLVRKIGRRGCTSFFRTANPSVCSRRLNRQDGEMLIEVLGVGAQTVLPPTIHPDTGEPYRWCGPATLLNTRLCELPEITAADIERIVERLAPWLRPKAHRVTHTPLASPLRHDRYAAAVVHRLCAELAETPEGGRNAKLNWASYRLSKIGLGFKQIEATLTPIALGIGLPPDEIAATIRSGTRAGANSRKDDPT